MSVLMLKTKLATVNATVGIKWNHGYSALLSGNNEHAGTAWKTHGIAERDM